MRKRIGIILGNVKKFNVKKSFFELFERVVAQKKQILIGISMVILIALGSFLIEYYGFGHQLRTLEDQNKGIFLVGNPEVVAENFALREGGVFVSQVENASLTISTEGRYVQNLKIQLGENPNYGISVKYVDPKSGKEIVLERNLQKSMQKNKVNFLDFMVFDIQNNPEKITVIAKNPQVSIANLSIDNAYHFNFHRFFFVFFIGILLVFIVITRKIVGKKPEYLFFVLALTCGTLISISEPLEYVSWDEAIHYKIADNNSLKNVVVKRVNDIYAGTNSIPASNSIKEQRVINEYFDGDVKEKIKDVKFKLNGFSPLESYNQLGHLPSSVALMLGRLMHLPYHIVFTFGRWINIFVYSAIIFFAIRKLKTGKMIMAVIALFPTAIFLASNYGYDYWVIAWTMLGFAYLFSELQQPEKKISKKDLLVMIGAFVIGLGPKAIYFPILLLLFLLKKEKFESLRQYKKFLLAVFLSLAFVIGSFLLPFVISGPGDGDSRGGKEVNSTEQVKFILSEPLEYSKFLFNFVKSYVNPVNSEGFVTSFAYLGNVQGLFLAMMALLVVIIFDKNKYDKATSGSGIKLSMILIYLGTVVLISTALYVAFTAVRSPIFAGVQPRYLLPLIFPLVYVLGSSRVKNPFNKNVFNIVIFSIMGLILLNGIWDLIISLHY